MGKSVSKAQIQNVLSCHINIEQFIRHIQQNVFLEVDHIDFMLDNSSNTFPPLLRVRLVQQLQLH
jgi:hypothetical protein